MTSVATPENLAFRACELSGKFNSFNRILATAPTAPFTAAPLVAEFVRLGSELGRLHASAAAYHPARPEVIVGRDLANQLVQTSFFIGYDLLSKIMRLTPDTPSATPLLTALASLPDQTPERTAVLNQSWLNLAQHHALRGNFATCAHVAQEALNSQTPAQPGFEEAATALAAARGWNGRGKSPFGSAFNRQRRSQRLRQMLHSTAQGFIGGAVVTPVLLGGVIMGFGGVPLMFLSGVAAGFSVPVIWGLTAAATAVTGICLYKIAGAVVRRAERLAAPLAPAVAQAKKITLLKTSSYTVGAAFGALAALTAIEALPSDYNEPVYYKQQTPPPRDDRQDWQKSAQLAPRQRLA